MFLLATGACKKTKEKEEEKADSEKLVISIPKQVGIVHTAGKEEAANEVAGVWVPSCPVGFQRSWSAQNIVSVCFHVSTEKTSWVDANRQCYDKAIIHRGCYGYLASILNQAENDFVSALMGDDHAWIGYYRYDGYHFRWTDYRRSAYTNFYPGEPNDGGRLGEDCTELMHNLGGRWNDRDCRDSKYYVCKAYCT